MKLNNIIKSPIITEKSTKDVDTLNRYTFRVGTLVSKNSIAQAIEQLFGVEVIDVRTNVMPGKQKRVARSARYTKIPKFKKAIVTIKEGQKIKLVTESK